VLGNKDEMAPGKRAAMNMILDMNAGSMEEFKAICAGKNNALGQAVNFLKDEYAPTQRSTKPGVHVYVCQGERYLNKILQLMRMIADTDADVVYIVNTELLCRTNILRIAQERHPHTIFSYTSISRDSEHLKRLYSSPKMIKLLQESEFIDLGHHEVGDRIYLSSILEFDKKQKGIISSVDGAEGILIAGDAMYIYDAKEDLLHHPDPEHTQNSTDKEIEDDVA
jgi:hypothetical protein